ncbi:hypothetical protein [Flavobacterium sp.]|uniref:hypothetical protein n=1 Tax=Flavobacterium sp. TaxID=239 RepID=UPI003D6C3EFA
MKEFDNLKEIWNQQKESQVPDVSQIISKARKEKQSMGNKILIQVAVLLLTIIGISLVVTAIDFKMLTTYIGIGLMFATILIFSAIRLYQAYKLKNIDLTQSPQKALQQLEQFYAFQKFVSTKCMLAYFILLNLGLACYFIEVMQPMSVEMKTIFLIAYIAWMLIAYFILGKKQKQKEYDKIQNIINGIRKIETEYEQ